MDRVIRGVTEQSPREVSVFYEVISAIREIPVSVTTMLQAPTSQSQAALQWRVEAIKGYMSAYYYAALRNLAYLYYLPSLEQLDDGNIFKRVQDSSYSDFFALDHWFSQLESQELKSNPLNWMYVEAHTNWRELVKDTTMVYKERATTATGTSG
jgi:hypothetical protein